MLHSWVCFPHPSIPYNAHPKQDKVNFVMHALYSLVPAVDELGRGEGGGHHKEEERRVQEDVLGEDQRTSLWVHVCVYGCACVW